MTTWWPNPLGTVTLSRRLGGTGVKLRLPTGSIRGAGPSAAAGRAWPTTTAPAPRAAVPSTDRRLMDRSTSSRIDSLPDWFGSGWSQAFPHRYLHVMSLRPPWGPEGSRGRRALLAVTVTVGRSPGTGVGACAAR